MRCCIYLSHKAQIDRCKNNTLASYAVLMKRWNIKVVYFTTSPVLQEACHKYRIDVIKEHLFPFSFPFTA